MGHTGDDAIHKIPHKKKTQWQNQLKNLVRVQFDILYRLRYIKRKMLYLSNAPLSLSFTVLPEFEEPIIIIIEKCPNLMG